MVRHAEDDFDRLIIINEDISLDQQFGLFNDRASDQKNKICFQNE